MGKACLTWGFVGLALVMTGCATLGGGMTPEEEIRAKLDPWSQAFVAQDIETVMSFYSEDFDHYEYNDKAGLQSFLKDAVDMGYLNDAVVDMQQTVVTVEGETATAGPIGLQASFGSAMITLTLKDESDGWKIVGMEVEMQ